MGLEPPYLGDRRAQLERFAEFLDDVSTPHNVVVTGLRGVGKTVLLQRYNVEALEAGWLIADREFSEADAEPSMFAQRVLADLNRLTRDLSVSRRVKDAAGGAVERVTDLLGSLTVSYSGVEVGYSPGRRSSRQPKQMLDDDLREALREVGRLCQKSDHPGFVLQYDEFHVVKEERGDLTLSALLAAAAAVQREGMPVMLVLCGLPTILENLGRSKSYSERMFTVEQIGHLTPPEDRAALLDPAVARGRRFADEVVDAVLDDTLGYPYSIQLYGDALWKGTASEPVIGIEDFRRLRPRIIEGLDRSFFESRYRRASAREQRVLKAIAAGGGESATTENLRARLQMSNSDIQPLLRFLVEKGLIYRPSRGRVAFTAPMFGAFVRRRPDDAD
jgi:hypothetical protein